MPPPPRAKEALVAMKNIGFSSKLSGPILKKLLAVFENNWEYIEQDGYQVLIDAILEEQEKKAVDDKMQDVVAGDDPEHSRKKLRRQSEIPSSSMPGSDAPIETPLKKPKEEPDVFPESEVSQRRAELVPLQIDYSDKPVPKSLHVDDRGREELASSDVGNRGKMSELNSPQPSPNSEKSEHDLPLITRRETRALSRARKVAASQENAVQGLLGTCSADGQPAGERPRDLVFKEPKIEPGTEVLKESKSTSPCRLKDKEDDDLPESEVLHHSFGARNEAHQSQKSRSNSSLRGINHLRVNDIESIAAQNVPHKEDKEKGKESSSGVASENGMVSEFGTAQGTAVSAIEIASSDTGAVKLQLSFKSDCPDFYMPKIDVFFKMVEERCLKSYKILPPDSLLLKVMKEMCQVASELTAEPSNDMQENIVKLTPASGSMRKSDVQNILGEMPVNGSTDGL